MRLVLASKSASRAALLRGAAVSFEMEGAGVDEDASKRRMAGESPRDIAGALAAEKALAVAARTEGLVIGADQTLELDGRLYDKAVSLAEARERLLALRGRTHALHSAIVVAEGARVVWSETVSATLTMRGFSDEFLDGYLARNSAAALGSVGCYQLEGEGVQLFERVDGDYFTILGLPLFGLLGYLRRRGVLAT
jgi:septum formation protein